MNKIELMGSWNEHKGKLIQKYAFLTENDLMLKEGIEEEMYGKMQIKLGKKQRRIAQNY
jgi:uncharacterized protein YjbJ (UPF0337 family)